MKKNNISIKYIILILLLVVAFILSIAIGSINVPVREVIRIIFGGTSDEIYRDIIIAIRLPRAIAALLSGGALALSGYSLQTFFKNPIAGPYILGISSGAKLMVAFIFIAGGGVAIGGSFGMMFAAFLGAIISMSFVLLCAKKVDNMALLLVCGVMIGYICTAITDFLVTFANDADIVNLHNWSRGSLSGMTFTSTLVMGVVIMIASIGVFLMSKPMNAYIMGESYAKSLGVNVKAFRVILILVSSLLAATVTAFVGPVSFVGIAVPHLVRGYMKSSRPIIIIPASFLMGAEFTLLCDLIARTVFAPTELSISTVTAIFGAPVVIYLLVRNRIGK